MPLPEKIANAPELKLGLEIFYVAFMELTTCRAFGGMGEGPISWLTIHQYCTINKIKGEQREDMMYFISNLDAKYLEYKAEKIKAKTK